MVAINNSVIRCALFLSSLIITSAGCFKEKPHGNSRQLITEHETVTEIETVTNVLCVTNFVTITNQIGVTICDNGLGEWLSDTNHTAGPKFAKSIFVLQYPDGKFYVRWKDYAKTNSDYEQLFQTDRAYNSAADARSAISLNISLFTHKSMSDAVEDAFRGLK